METHLEDCEVLADGVVQFSTEAAAFGVLGAKKMRRKLAKGKFGIVELALSFAALGNFPFQGFLGLAQRMEKSLLGFKRLSLLLQLGNITQTILFAGESGVAFARNHGECSEQIFKNGAACVLS